MRLAILILPLMLALPSCTESLGGAQNSEVVVTQNQIRLAGPRGYCVDPNSVQNGETQAFAVFGNCAAISGSFRTVQPKDQAIALTSVTSLGLDTPLVSDAPSAFLGLFDTDAGKAALSRSNDAAQITVQESFVQGDIVYLRVDDQSPNRLPGAEPVFWRAYFDVGDSLVTISLHSFEDAPLSRDSSLGALQEFVTETRSQPAA